MFVLRHLLQGPRRTAFLLRIAPMLVAGVLANCTNSGNQDQQDAGGPPPNNCATQSAALNNTQCQLTLGQTVTDYIRALNDQVWYSIQMPSTLDPRTLVQVTAGYAECCTRLDRLALG